MPNDSTPYPIRLPKTLRGDIEKTAKDIGLKFPDTMRQAIKLGLPLLKEKFPKAAG